MRGANRGLPIRRAGTRRERLRGLAWRRRPAPYALLIDRCRSVHTFGMTYNLDLVWLGPDGSAVRVDRGVRPFRVKACRSASGVLELPAGPAHRAQSSGYTAAR